MLAQRKPPLDSTTPAAVARAQQKADPVPLCVDLDGTLIHGDSLYESTLLLLRQNFLYVLLLPMWLLKGRAFLKRQIATRVSLDPAALHYRRDVMNFVVNEHRSGRKIFLATAADFMLAEAVSQHLGIFSGVIASDGDRNMKSSAKAKTLSEKFGEKNFDYIGDSRADIAVWKRARHAYVVSRSKAFPQEVAIIADVKQHFHKSSLPLMAFFKAMRLHHWTKNILLFLPLLLSHQFTNLDKLAQVAVAFVLYGLTASAIYILNDLLDLHADRQHPWKKMRPFAAGELPIPTGLAMFAALATVSIAGSWLLISSKFAAVLVSYAVLSVWYSLELKKHALLDIFLLAGFYGIRIIAGGIVADVALSKWFLAFSLFLFFSMAMAKRFSELLQTGDLIRNGNSGRGYHPDDRDLLTAFGVVSGFAAIVILALYVQSDVVVKLYHRPSPLLLLCPLLLYWICRLWLTAHRGQLVDDPVTYTLRDRGSYAVGLLAVAVVTYAILPG